MTDEEYLFHSQSRDTKRIARGSYAKRGGSRSKSCRLPSDNLTQAQKKKLNGEVVVINMTEKKTWKQVLKMPRDLAVEYLTELKVKHNGRNKDIAEYLGTTTKCLSWFINQNCPELKMGARGHEPSKEWLKFIGADSITSDDEIEKPDDEIEVKPEPEQPVVKKEPSVIPKCNVMSGTLRFEGLPGIAFTKAMQILGNENYNLTIIFEEVCDIDSGA